MEAILEGDWSYLSGMYTTEQEVDFMSQLLSNCPLPDDETETIIPSFFWPAAAADADASYCSSDSYSPGSNNMFLSSSSQESAYYLTDSHPVFATTTSFLLEDDDSQNVEKGDKKIEETFVPNKNLEPKRETEMPKPEPIITEKNSKKRTRTSAGDFQKTKRNARSKKNQSSANNEEECNAGLNGQSWASCSSEDDSNASQELKEEAAAAVNLNGKTRASKGAATDPQSLYARKRRERINERLRILQNLVPNGTKVDISTMLEEAVQYVKFLQLQIKLLSSDDHWMYAPIAFNGMDIGLDLSTKRS